VKVPVLECGLKSLQVCALHVAQDEVGIISGPFHLSAPSYFWLLPFGAATGIALDKDNEAMQAVGFDTSARMSFAGSPTTAAFTVPQRPSPWLISPVALPTTTICRKPPCLPEKPWPTPSFSTPALGYAIDRQTPMQGNGIGNFWPHSTRTWPDGQSMPSDHSILVWSFAHVVASQYSGIVTQLIVYSLATTVSASRVMAREHFPSDVFVGAALGYVIGGYVTERRSSDSAWDHFSVQALRTANGNGLQLSYAFSR
jgi:membrane-associated phospholipid phosphatase